MADAFLGEIRLFAGVRPPSGWMFCTGTMLQINDYQALFSLLGNKFGGSAPTTFALPDLRGRIPIGTGKGPQSTTTYPEAWTGGTATVTLTTDNLPSHSHTISVSGADATTNVPDPSVTFAVVASPLRLYIDGAQTTSGTVPFDPDSIVANSGNTSHENRMPCLTLNYIICVTQGSYPGFQ
ncbi:MAG: phage tail protein [Rhodospirillales bacterium]|jgi:microcystin-dependent protein|nr:phage tail protein [Rhodospirillales bacterium]